MMNEIIEETKTNMQKSIVALESELVKVRTGRAHPSLVEHLKVDYYGSMVPLSQVANIAVEDARTLSLTPWEKNMVAPIEKVIMNANLGLNPASAGTVIRIPLPALTEERRKGLARTVRDEAEKTKVSIRNSRRDANSQLDALEKEKEISEDDKHRAQASVQKLTDEFIVQVDQVADQKEKDVMSV